jgi:predicted PurR-regulated permease PerM
MTAYRRRRPDLPLAATLALGVAAGLLLAAAAQGILVRLRDILVILLISLFLSFGMEPAVKWLDDRGLRRGAGTFLVFLASFLLLVAFFAAMAPLIIDQVRNLVEGGRDILNGLAEQARTLPGGIGDTIADWLEDQRSELPRRVPELAPRLAGDALGLGATLLGTLLQSLTILLVTFYLVADGPKLRRVLSSRMEPIRQREFLAWWDLAVEKTGGYLYSRVLTAVASAIFHIAVFSIIGVPYSIALGAWVGIISSLIPVIGTYLAGLLPIVIALSASFTDAIWVLVAVVLYQQVENYFVAPRITAHTLSLHPAIAFLSVLIGAALLGAPGALLALPAAAIVAAFASASGERHEVVEHDLLQTRSGSGERDAPPPAD